MKSSGLKSARSLPGDHGPGVAHVVLDVERAVVPHEAGVTATPGGVVRGDALSPPGRLTTAPGTLSQGTVPGGVAGLAGTFSRPAVTLPVSGTVVRAGGGEVAGAESLHHVVRVGVEKDQHGARAGRQ